MANKTPLASWLYTKRQELNLRFKEFNWPARVFPGLYDFSTTISWNGIESSGRGVDLRREIALEKSVAESIERLICKTLGFDSVGFAVAGTHDPTDHAKFEALERFFLRRHLEAGIPFSQVHIENDEIQKFRRLNSVSSVNFFRMQTPSQIVGLVCSMKSQRDQSTALGFGLSDSLEKSIQRAFKEALPNFAWLTDGEQDLKSEKPWHIDPNFLAQIEPLFIRHVLQDPESQIEMPQLLQMKIEKSGLSILKDAPIHLARFSIVDERNQ